MMDSIKVVIPGRHEVANRESSKPVLVVTGFRVLGPLISGLPEISTLISQVGNSRLGSGLAPE